MQPMRMSAPQDEYLKQGILTANPVELVIMLYDGLKKNLLLAKRAMTKGMSPAVTHDYLMKAQAIVAELINSLNMSVEMSRELLTLYDYMLYSMIEINTKKEPELVDALVEIVQDLKGAWEELGGMYKGTLSIVEDQG